MKNDDKTREQLFKEIELLKDKIAKLEKSEAEEVVRKSEEKFKSLFEHMQNGFALHQMVFDEAGTPIDYIFLDVNKAFEKQTALKRDDLIGRKVTDVIPGIKNDPADWRMGVLPTCRDSAGAISYPAEAGFFIS